jgi:hypothetical protein
MNPVAYARLAGTIFAIVALAHVARLVLGTPVVIGEVAVPMAASWVGGGVAAALAVLGWRARA